MRCLSRLMVTLCVLAASLIGGELATAQSHPKPQNQQEPGAQPEESGSGSEQPADNLDDKVGRKFSGEITVTASRREVNIRELPASVAVTEGRDLESMGATSMDDYVRQVPGVNYVDAAPQRDSVTIRGIATSVFSNLNQQPVGTYINETPVTDYFLYMTAVDMMGFDLERVEFLKGPQGTMYGAASLGGTMRYILNMPNLDRNEGALHLTGQVVEDGGFNWLAQGMFNVVLADGKFALRGVAGYKKDEGWIDNAYLQEQNWNHFEDTNLRLMASWMPTDRLRLDFTHLRRDTTMNDSENTVDGPDIDNPTTATDEGGRIRMMASGDQKISNLTLTWDLGFGELVSSTSFLDKSMPTDQAYGGKQVDDALISEAAMFGLPPEYYTNNIHEASEDVTNFNYETWYQEIRLVSRDIGTFDWMAGLFWADSKGTGGQHLAYPGIEDLTNAAMPGIGTLFYPDDTWANFTFEDVATELSLYAECGIDLSEKWKLNLGGRFTDWQRTTSVDLRIYYLQFAESPPFEEQIFSPKASIAYRASDDTLWYALASKGYRTGGSNFIYIGTGGTQEDFYYFETDRLWNYESGVKKTWLGGRLTTDLTLFYLDWTDLQLEALFFTPTGEAVNAIFNTSAAHSLGAEAAITARLARGLTFSTAFAYTEAELDEPSPPLVDQSITPPEIVVLQPGTPLPATPKWSFASTLQYFWDNSRLGFPFIAIDHFYRDSIVVDFTSQNTTPAYDTWALRIGATLKNRLNLTLTVRNLTDNRAWEAILPSRPYTNFPGYRPQAGFLLQPRAVSLSIQKNF